MRRSAKRAGNVRALPLTLRDWSVWDWAILRAPGFPAAEVLALRAPDTTAATDRLVREADQVSVARAAAIDVLQRGSASKPVNKAIKALRRGESPASLENLGDATPIVEAFARSEASRAQAQQAAEQVLDDESRKVAQALHDVASEPRFREALLWQNRMAVHASIGSLLRRPIDANDSKTREQRRLVASCLQRYCVKNDTIGFFGPVGWARLTAEPDVLTVTPGPSIVAARNVYFEYWCIDALAQRLAQDVDMRPFLKPRRAPSVWLDGLVLHSNGKTTPLPEDFARALAACDGELTARQIAQQLVTDTALGLTDEAEVFELLEELQAKGLCSWTFDIPTATFHPEQHLKTLLSAAEGDVGARGLHALDRLEQRRAAVAEAAGDPDRLDAALGELEATFEELTAESATRKGGETYAGRTLIYEDCRRDLDITLGSKLLDRLAAPLALVLDSARWYTYTIATRFEEVFHRVYDELREGSSGTSGEIEYLRYLEHLKPHFPGPEADRGIGHDVATALQAHWDSILGLGAANAGVRQIERTSAELQAAAAVAFDAPSPGWPSARHHSPDVLIAAESVDALRRGELRIVLGELHVGLNTVTIPCLLKEHPEPEVLVQAREADLPEPGIGPVWSKARTRADFFSVSRHDFDLETATRSARPRDHVLTAGALVVEEVAGQLVVRSRESGRSFHLTAVLEHHLIAESFSRFRLVSRRAHMPRILIDGVVLQRETWTFGCDAVAFAGETTELGRFMGARRFAQRHGMPRFVYTKTDTEVKPFFVDLESPILIEILARQIKRSTRVTVSEMSPGFSECWLPDATGGRYTSELRLAVTDPKPWVPSAPRQRAR